MTKIKPSQGVVEEAEEMAQFVLKTHAKSHSSVTANILRLIGSVPYKPSRGRERMVWDELKRLGVEPEGIKAIAVYLAWSQLEAKNLDDLKKKRQEVARELSQPGLTGTGDRLLDAWIDEGLSPMRLIEAVAEEEPGRADQLLQQWLDYIFNDRKTELRERLRTIDLYRTKRFLIKPGGSKWPERVLDFATSTLVWTLDYYNIRRRQYGLVGRLLWLAELDLVKGMMSEDERYRRLAGRARTRMKKADVAALRTTLT